MAWSSVYHLTRVLRVRQPGAARLDGSGSESPKGLQSRCWPWLQSSVSSFVVVIRTWLLAGCWLDTSAPGHVVLSIGLLTTQHFLRTTGVCLWEREGESVSLSGYVTLWTVPAKLLCPWDSAGKNTGVGCHALLQGIFPVQGSNSHFLHLLHWQVGS